jgi:hypothetical protein
MPKGEKIRPKQQMDQLSLENFENSRIEFLIWQKSLICQKLASCGENGWLWEKGEFLNLWSISLGTTLFISQQVWFAKTNQVVAKNDPYMPNLNQNKFEFSFALMLHFV